MIGTLDSQVIEKFKEFQAKTGTCSDLDIENVEFYAPIVEDIFDIVRRGASPRPIKNFLVNDYDNIKKFNWLKIGDVTKSSIYLKKTSQYINEEGMSKSILGKKGDFLITNSMTVGVPIILDIDTCFHDGFLYLGFNNRNQEKYYSLYLFYFFTSYRQKLIAKSKDGIVKNLNTDIIKKVDIPIPKDFNEKYKSFRIQKVLVEFIEYWKTNFTDVFRQSTIKQKLIVENIKKVLIPSTLKHDKTLTINFNKFAKENKYDIKLNDIIFEEVDFFSIKKDDLLLPKKLEKNQDLVLRNSSEIGYPVYTGGSEYLCKVQEFIYSNKIFIPNKENPDISFANNGDGSSGRNFFIHKNKYFVNQERTIISFKNDDKFYSLYILNQINTMREKYNMNRENRPTPKELPKFGIKVLVPFHDKFSSIDIQKILTNFWSCILDDIECKLANYNKVNELTTKIDKAFLDRTFSKIDWRQE